MDYLIIVLQEQRLTVYLLIIVGKHTPNLPAVIVGNPVKLMILHLL